MIKAEARRKICVLEASQCERDPERRLRWGDYHLGRHVARAFERLGHEVVDHDADVVVHLWGFPQNLPLAERRIVWISSHPEAVTPVNLLRYDHIFCQSSAFSNVIRRAGFECEHLVGGTGLRPLPQPPPLARAIVFVGNPKGRSRPCVDALGSGYDLHVWGERWGHLGQAWKGIYYPNDELPALYASAVVCLNDHSETMRRWGFINGRIMDVLISGGFCISDYNPGVSEVFGDAVPMWREARELRQLVDHYLAHPDERTPLMERGRAIAERLTFDAVAERMAAHL